MEFKMKLSWEDLGVILANFWGSFGRPSWPVLEASWAVLEAS